MKRRSFFLALRNCHGTLISTPSFSMAGDDSILPVSSNLMGEDYWDQIRAQYRTGTLINLNNGGVSPHPLIVEEAFFNYHRMCNEVPSFHMWRTLDKLKTNVRSKLAEIAGCSAEEIATNRNATEGLVTIIMNLPIKRGDDVVLSKFDYPRMTNAWIIREERDGIILRWINPEEDSPDDATIIFSLCFAV